MAATFSTRFLTLGVVKSNHHWFGLREYLQRCSHEIWGVPVNIPLNQSNDKSNQEYVMISKCIATPQETIKYFQNGIDDVLPMFSRFQLLNGGVLPI